jgi:sodium/potassium-transporting ATPase subunit alpha
MKGDEGDIAKRSQSTFNWGESKKKDEKKENPPLLPDLSKRPNMYKDFQPIQMNSELPTQKNQVDTPAKQLFDKLLTKIKLDSKTPVDDIQRSYSTFNTKMWNTRNFEHAKNKDKKEPVNQATIELSNRKPDHQPLKQADEAKKEEGGKDEFGLGTKPWHSMSVDEILGELVSNIKEGLSIDDHTKRLIEHGPNRITPKEETHWIIKFIINMIGGFQLFLWAGGILCVIVYCVTNFTDYQTLALGILCFLVVVLTAVFQTYQEGKSSDVMAALRALTPDEVSVYRGGDLKKVLAESLVPGDIVSVKSGEKVPADVRVLSCSELKVNNASLTGENVDIKLGVDPNSESLYEAKNIARMGCNFTNGAGICIVFATGDNTFFGNIAKSTTSTERPESCLTKEIKRLVHIMGGFAITVGIIFLILALVSGYKAVDAVVFMIGIIVANVPEGLLPQMTVALTLTANRMREKDVIVTHLEIVETLGAVTVICSDKTGTLTCNRMTVSHMVYNEKIFTTPISPKQDGENLDLFDANDSSFKALHKIALLNTEAVFTSFEEDVLKRTVAGDASEAALIKFAVNINDVSDIVEFRKKYEKPCSIPFNSTNKWMCTVSKDSNASTIQVLFKGAPEKVTALCNRYLSHGEVKNMVESDKKKFEDLNTALAKRGERVLGFAYRDLDYKTYENHAWESDPPNFPLDDLVFVGYFSLIDPPREGVKESIIECHNAGVKVFMVTGDHPTTAHAIAKSLNLITKPTKDELIEQDLPIPPEGCKSIVIKGSDMTHFTPEKWEEVLNHDEIVFARTMPQQKQEIVLHLQKRDHIIAMTGDGVNDAPALKAAHVGIAMGSGSQVAKDAGQLILVNDDFKCIVEGIREGRLIFDNLKKTICYVLSSNIPELIPFLLFIAMKIPLSIETIMIILIDVGTDLLPAISLAYEEPESSIMQIPPRKPDSHLVGLQLMITAYGTIGLFETFGAYFSWAWVWYAYEFTINDLMGSGIAIREKWIDMSNENKDFFLKMCSNSKYYQRVEIPKGKNCQQDFKDFLIDLLAISQSAFLMCVVWSQIANLFIRKTQIATVLNWDRIKSNTAIFWALLSEIVVIVLVIYVPGLNKALLLTHVDPVFASTGLWMMLFIFIWDEVRKYLCRRDPAGWFAKYSVI